MNTSSNIKNSPKVPPMTTINGIRLMTNDYLTVAGEATEVGRTFHDRWFTWPWRPWVKTWMYVPRLPDPHLYRIQDHLDGQAILGHPETVKDVLTIIEARNNARR